MSIRPPPRFYINVLLRWLFLIPFQLPLQLLMHIVADAFLVAFYVYRWGHGSPGRACESTVAKRAGSCQAAWLSVCPPPLTATYLSVPQFLYL